MDDKRPRGSGITKNLKWILGVSIAFLVLYVLASQTMALPAFFRLPGPPAVQPIARDERWRQDVRYLAAQLPRLHVNAFHTMPKRDFERAIANLEAAVPSLTDLEIALEIVRIAALVGDAHTQAIPPSSLGHHLYPIKLYWLKDGFYVIGSAPAYGHAIGAKLVQIGEVLAEDATDALTPYVSHETETGLKADLPFNLVCPEVLRAAGVLRDTGPGRFLFEGRDGKPFTLDLLPVSPDEYYETVQGDSYVGEPPLYERHPDLAYWFEHLPDAQAVYLRYRKCVDMEDKPFRQLNAELFAFVDANPVSRTIIDLRGNGGGHSNLLKPFLQELESHPDMNRDGRLYAIVGRGTYSSAVLNVVELKEKARGIVAGEPPSSAPNHYGEAQMFVLPNSGIKVYYSTKWFPMSSLAAGTRLSIADWLGVLGYSSARYPSGTDGSNALLPDLQVELSADDYFSGRDPVLEAILIGR